MEDDEEMIDEIIETDPDEAQHHPIVDGNDEEAEGTMRGMTFGEHETYHKRANFQSQSEPQQREDQYASFAEQMNHQDS